MGAQSLVLLFMLSPLMLSARDGRGTIAGNIANPEGIVRIVATNLNTGERFSAVADGAGGFTLGSLSPGSYRVILRNEKGTASARRFLKVRAGETLRLNAKLEAVPLPRIDGMRTGTRRAETVSAADLPPVMQQFGESSRYLNAVVLVNDNNGWAVGDPRWDQATRQTKGTIINTKDGGVTWTNQDPGVTVALNGLFFLNTSQGWVVGDNGTILRTTDGGAHWVQEPVSTGDSFVSVSFTDALNGWAASYTPIKYDYSLEDFVDWQASIWHSTDGGQTWSPQTVPASAMLLKRVFFVNPNTGFAAGTKRTGYDEFGSPQALGGIYGTTDGGHTWNEVFATGAGFTFTALYFTDASNGWAAGFPHSSDSLGACGFHTSDGGKTWQPQNLNFGGFIEVVRDLHMLDANRGYAAGTAYAGVGTGTWVWRTLDGGATWTTVAMQNTNPLTVEGYWGLAVTADRVLIVGDRDVTASSTHPWDACSADLLVCSPGCWCLFTQAYVSPHYMFEDVFFTDQNRGWAAGTRTFSPNLWGQEIFHTVDGGNTWQTQYEDAPPRADIDYHRLESISFTDPLHGWAVGTSRKGSDYKYHNAILHTADGGATWQEQGQDLPSYDGDLEFAVVQFLDQQNGWALATWNYPSPDVFLARTSDGGNHWSWVDTGIAGGIDSGFDWVLGGMRFIDAQHGCFAGAGAAGCTNDGGAHWAQSAVGCAETPCYLYSTSVAFSDPLHGWITGREGALYQTTDGGAHWSPKTMSGQFEDMLFANSSTGWLSGTSGLLFHTTDAGADWQSVNTGTGSDLLGLSFTDPTHGWIVGDFGTILSYAGDRTPAGKPAVFAAANAASYATQTSPDAWISIYGANLSATTRSWKGSDFIGNKLPTSLDGVSVLVNGNPAYLSYISPGQINAMFPDDGSTGQVSVQVVNSQGSSGTLAVQKAVYSPALFRFSVDQGNYVIAQTTDGHLVANTWVWYDLGHPANMRTANPGEIVTLYGTGFGPTSPAISSATLVGAPAPLASQVTFTIGGAAAVVEWAGMIGSGLYQFNVQVPPNATSGDLVIVADIGGYRSQGNSVISVGHVF